MNAMKRKKFLQILTMGATAAALTAGTVGCGSGSSADADQAAQSASSDTGQELSSDATESSSELTTIRAAVASNAPDHWVAIIGEEKGILADYGLELEVTEFAAGINTVDAITTDQADIGSIVDYAIINRIGNTLEDTDIRILARLSSMSEGYYLYVDSSAVGTLSDLAGQSIVTLTGTVYDYWNARIVEEAGLSEEEVEIVGVDSQSAGLAVITSGEATVMWGNGMTAIKLEEAGLTSLGSLSDYGMSNNYFYVASAEYLEENQETLETFYLAAAEILDWINDNPDEAAEILSDKLDLDVDEELATMESFVNSLDYKDEITEQLAEVEEWTYENGYFDTDFDVADYVDTSALEAALPDRME